MSLRRYLLLTGRLGALGACATALALHSACQAATLVTYDFTGATGEVRPCVQVDGKPVGDGRVGPVTRALSDAFLKLVERTKREGRRSTKETAAIAR